MARTLQDVLALCREKDVKIVDFKMTDIDGRWRHLSIPVDRLNEDTIVYGIGFGGEQRHGLCSRSGLCNHGPFYGNPHPHHDR